ncbi:3-oxoacyl-[acyl-carrier-protein] synthase, mitochondrial-like [Mizuhopecten yessoensis]|uniref:3-oxoacyl-[acyl-carrier-protein] synthase n=1 Tax=Mizuhopecten yessoensis TaxID=6573 RepID=A0A210QTT6_MIZYE|nr:3-oxoacyl-[acyl-carrier-protein] synthase, mitochondrial-like [Mizuhopecten yessoensis]OWF52156.1 3-oxoacyl-[acyl-carrier-protein] synthase, mitochondrial [Mizuhopecten yessoensis]
MNSTLLKCTKTGRKIANLHRVKIHVGRECLNSDNLRTVKLRRVVVTGLGLVTCLGVGSRHVWDRIIKGQCGISTIKGPGYENVPCKVAGFVPRGSNPGDLRLEDYMSVQEQRIMSQGCAYALVATEEALTDAGWEPNTEEEKNSTGVAIGMGMVGMEETYNTGVTLRERGYSRVSPFFMPKILINMTAGNVSVKYGLQGPNHSVSTACTTGLHAVGDAFRFIQRGDAEVMVAGGAEESPNPLSVAGFSRMRALSTKFNDNPHKASRPFDKDRDGFVMSEGSGILVLEELEHALGRGADIYAEILGYGLSGDANHMTAPQEDGSGAYRCMVAALKDAQISKSDIGYINAHATSTPLGDLAESRAIWRLFGETNPEVLVSSTKGATGHLLGSAGCVEAMFAVMACHGGKIPPTVNLCESDTGLPLKYVTQNSVDWPSGSARRLAVTNSFGFGGTNGSLCIGSFNKN